MSAHITYPAINDAINQVFFDGRFAGRPVYLSLDNHMRAELASILGIDESTIEDSVCAHIGEWLSQRGDPYHGELIEAKHWRKNGMASPPPFTAVLFCLSHAAAIMA